MADILSEEELDALLTQMKPDDGDDEKAPEPSSVSGSTEGASSGLDLRASPSSEGGTSVAEGTLRMILGLPVQARVEIGRCRLPSARSEPCQGSVLELDHLASDLLDTVVNNQVVARGEAVVVNENFGVRVLNVIALSPVQL